MPASPGLASPIKAENGMSNEAPQSRAISPRTAPQIMATNDIHSSVSPLSIYYDVVAKEGVIEGGSYLSTAPRDTAAPGDCAILAENTTVPRDTIIASSTTASEDTAVAEAVPVSDRASQDPPIEINASLTLHTIPGVEVSRDSSAPGDVNTQNDRLVNDSFMDPGSPKSHAETVIPDSGTRMSPDPEPVSSSAKGKQPKRRTKPTVDLDSLPNPEEELTDAQIASLFPQPPKIRQRYTRYFSGTGIIRAAYVKLLFERLPDGELRFSEDIFRSCLPRWRDRLEAFDPGVSSQKSEYQTRKRKGTVTPAKRGAHDEIDSRQSTKQKAAASKNTELPVGPPPSEPGPSSSHLPTLRLRPLGGRRTALSTDLSAGIMRSQPSIAHRPSSSEPGNGMRVVIPQNQIRLDLLGDLKPISTTPLQNPAIPVLGQKQNMQGDSSEGHHINLSGVPNMDYRKPVFGKYPAQSSRAVNVGGSQLLDPGHRSGLIQYLTNEIHQLDYVVLNVAQSSDDSIRLHPLQNLWRNLVELRNSCVDLDVKQRCNDMITKDRDEMDKL